LHPLHDENPLQLKPEQLLPLHPENPEQPKQLEYPLHPTATAP
jgi:hypothetical protein